MLKTSGAVLSICLPASAARAGDQGDPAQTFSAPANCLYYGLGEGTIARRT